MVGEYDDYVSLKRGMRVLLSRSSSKVVFVEGFQEESCWSELSLGVYA